jgi:hypothetical protein
MNNQATRYVNSAKFPIRFDKLHPGSLFRIHSELSRGIQHSRDNRIYRKAREHEGFYATLEGNSNVAACIHPQDMVQPIKREKV